MSHTKGEWFVLDYAGFLNIQDVPNYVEGHDLLDVEDVGRETAKANAKLMAAAPELLEALQEVVRISDRNHVAWDKAKEAIKKAIN